MTEITESIEPITVEFEGRRLPGTRGTTVC